MIRSRLTELCQQAVESLPLAGASAVGEDKSGQLFERPILAVLRLRVSPYLEPIRLLKKFKN